MTKLIKYDVAQVMVKMNDLYGLLTAEQKSEFVRATEIMKFKRGEIIYFEGDKPEFLLCVLSGKVKIYRDGVGGRSFINRVLRPVQYFGYRASLANEPYVTEAAAFDDTLIACVPLALIRRILTTNTNVCQFFIKELAVDLGEADKRIVSVTQKHVRGRLAEALLMLADIYGYDTDGVTLNTYISRGDLASLSNMNIGNAIRTLSELNAEGITASKNRMIQVLDKEALREISELGEKEVRGVK